MIDGIAEGSEKLPKVLQAFQNSASKPEMNGVLKWNHVCEHV